MESLKEKFSNFMQNLKQVNILDIDWGALLSWEYLTDTTPNKKFIYEQWIYVIVLINLIISIIGFRFISRMFVDEKPKFKQIRKLSFLWFANSILLLLYNLLRSEGVAVLSMRLILVIILVLFLIIVIYAVIDWFFVLPRRLDFFRQAKLRDKYSSNRKRK